MDSVTNNQRNQFKDREATELNYNLFIAVSPLLVSLWYAVDFKEEPRASNYRNTMKPPKALTHLPKYTCSGSAVAFFDCFP